jgi:hypothetical protein
MDLGSFVAQLSVDFDAVTALAGVMAVGVFAFVQALKVFGILTEPTWTGRAALIVAAVEGALVVLGYFFPAFIPVGLIIYGTAIAVSAAGLGYQYLAKPIIGALFPSAAIASDELNPAK